MPDLFISYARSDSRDFVARLSAALEERGKDTWVDLDDIPPASSWNDDLRTGIAQSDSFGFVISPARWVKLAKTRVTRELTAIEKATYLSGD